MIDPIIESTNPVAKLDESEALGLHIFLIAMHPTHHATKPVNLSCRENLNPNDSNALASPVKSPVAAART
jgi:hypothetical protein